MKGLIMRVAVLLLIVVVSIGLVLVFKGKILNTGFFSKGEVMKETALDNESSFNILFLHHRTG